MKDILRSMLLIVFLTACDEKADKPDAGLVEDDLSAANLPLTTSELES